MEELTNFSNKPSWDDAPHFAKYLAQDECGEWVWYECLPEASIQSGLWIPNADGDYCYASDLGGTENPQWADTLEERP
jgi:hypothetical protein